MSCPVLTNANLVISLSSLKSHGSLSPKDEIYKFLSISELIIRGQKPHMRKSVLSVLQKSRSVCTVQTGAPSNQPHVATERLKCSWYRLRCTVGLNYTLEVENLVREKVNCLIKFLYPLQVQIIFSI